MKKVILIDGNNILFRSYYATAYSGNTMKNSKGFPTNALYGLINMIQKIIKEENPEYIMVALDKGKTFRHDEYKDYKAGRIEMPDELKQQFSVAKKLLNAMGITYYEVENYEADDIIGTFAKKIDDPNDDFIGTIISSDKDLLQLISKEVEVKLLKPTGFVRMSEEEFYNVYGLAPIRMIDLKGLMGDSSDNIPGVKGIGEKTALTLLHQYDTIENLYDHIDEVKGKVKEKLIAGKESAFESKKLATIYRDVPVDLDFNKIVYRGVDTLAYIQLLEELEFYSLIKKMDIPEEIARDQVVVDKTLDRVKIVTSLDDITLDEPYAVYLEVLGENYHKGTPLGFGVYNAKNAFYIPFGVLLQKPDFFATKTKKYTYDLKKILAVCMYHHLPFEGCKYDLMIAGYLLNKNVKNDPAYLANTYGYDIPFYDAFFGTTAKPKLYDEEELAKLCVNKAKFVYDTYDEVTEEIEKNNDIYLFQAIEMPLVEVLADMEVAGIDVDRDYLSKMGEMLQEKMKDIENEVYRLAGTSFNILSPKQLGEVLFQRLQIPYPKKVKNETYSTSKEILDKLAPDYPIVDFILDYRTYAKLYANYTVGLIQEIASDGKIHTTFNQTLTRTGRLSSESPNLQNIPVRLELGKLIRKAFLPTKDAVLMSSDYSQIELRIFAHMCKAPNMIEAFKEDKDIHAKTASDIYHKPIEEVTKNERRSAKAVNFGIIYGISSFGLSEDLGIDVKSAKAFIDDYLNTFPGIKDYMNQVVKEAHEKGYSTTIMNRKRIIDELNNKNYMIRQQGERMALNTPIQGSAADILKKAMVEIYAELKKRNLKSKMLIQVHDELVLNVYQDELDEVKELVCNIMENTYPLDVPLKVDIETGSDWYDAK